MAETVRDWRDIGYWCVAEPHPGAPEHTLDFKVYGAYSASDGTPLFERAGAASHPDPVTTVAEAQVFVSGSVKWDGCSNVYFDEQDEAMLHFCSKEQAVNVGVLLGRLYALAAELIPRWDGE